MKALFYLLPIIVSVFIILYKRRAFPLRKKSEKKYAIREFIANLVEIVLTSSISIFAYIILNRKVQIWSLLIDVLMLVIYLILLFRKEYNYKNRQAVIGMWASIIVLLILAVFVFQSLNGKYKIYDFTLLYCFIKSAGYFFISIWACFTTDKKNKTRTMLLVLKQSFKEHQMGKLEFYMFVTLEIFILMGANGNVVPIPIYGLHEVLNHRLKRGFAFIIVGMVCLIPLYLHFNISAYTWLIYTIVAILDICIQIFKDLYRLLKNFSKRKS